MIIQPRRFNPRKTVTVLAVLCVAFYFYFNQERPPRLWKISGAHWSDYNVKIVDGNLSLTDVQKLKDDIDGLLDSINRQMSTYIPDSEISLFNAVSDTDPHSVSPALASVTRRAMQICVETGGAFNPTLDHLINLWGFGHHGARHAPSETEVAAALAFVGCDKIDVTGASSIRKTIPEAMLNLNAIAEGWAVDETSRLLEAAGVTNYFVEIGGEVFARGSSEKARPWRVGIDRPVEGALPGEAYDIIAEVESIGIATSGSYRNFVKDDEGRTFAHILDPRSGHPAKSSLASVTVAATSCADADAFATALFVMGPEEGMKWVEAHEGVEAVFIELLPDGTFKPTFSPGFPALASASN